MTLSLSDDNGIANVLTVDRRVKNLREAGVEVEYRRYETAGHGFGLGTGTDAEGWLDLAVQFDLPRKPRTQIYAPNLPFS